MSKVFIAGVWCSSPEPRTVQVTSLLDVNETGWVEAPLHPRQGSNTVFLPVSIVLRCDPTRIIRILTVTGRADTHSLLHSRNCETRVIFVSIFAMIGNRYGQSSTLASVVVLQFLGSPTFLCILGSRMFFNLRESAERWGDDGSESSLADNSHNGIQFDSRTGGNEQ